MFGDEQPVLKSLCGLLAGFDLLVSMVVKYSHPKIYGHLFVLRGI